MPRLVCLVLACGCGAQLDTAPGSTDEPGKGDDPNGGAALTGGGFLTQLGNLECDRAFACRADFPKTPGDTFELEFGSTLDECHALVDEDFMPSLVDAAIAAGTIHFDPSKAMTCLARTTFGADCVAFFVNGPTFDPSCDAVFAGTVDVGGACTLDRECRSDACDGSACVN
jgi:hypothetical protein